jgi:hypothetical protein
MYERVHLVSLWKIMTEEVMFEDAELLMYGSQHDQSWNFH